MGVCLFGSDPHTYTHTHTHTPQRGVPWPHLLLYDPYVCVCVPFFTPQVSVCPFNIITGYTLFVEDEDKSVDAVLTRSDMEAHMVGGVWCTRIHAYMHVYASCYPVLVS